MGTLGPSVADPFVTMIVRETLGQVCTPEVADRLLYMAFKLAGIGELPAVGEALTDFVRKPLHAAIVQTLGEGAADAVVDELDPILAGLPVPRGPEDGGADLQPALDRVRNRSIVPAQVRARLSSAPPEIREALRTRTSLPLDDEPSDGSPEPMGAIAHPPGEAAGAMDEDPVGTAASTMDEDAAGTAAGAMDEDPVGTAASAMDEDAAGTAAGAMAFANPPEDAAVDRPQLAVLGLDPSSQATVAPTELGLPSIILSSSSARHIDAISEAVSGEAALHVVTDGAALVQALILLGSHAPIIVIDAVAQPVTDMMLRSLAAAAPSESTVVVWGRNPAELPAEHRSRWVSCDGGATSEDVLLLLRRLLD